MLFIVSTYVKLCQTLAGSCPSTVFIFYSIILYCIILYYIYYIILYLYYIILYLYYIILYYIILYYIILYFITLHGVRLYYIVIFKNVPSMIFGQCFVRDRLCLDRCHASEPS